MDKESNELQEETINPTQLRQEKIVISELMGKIMSLIATDPEAVTILPIKDCINPSNDNYIAQLIKLVFFFFSFFFFLFSFFLFFFFFFSFPFFVLFPFSSVFPIFSFCFFYFLCVLSLFFSFPFSLYPFSFSFLN